MQRKKVVFVSNLQENLYEALLIKELATKGFDVNSITAKDFVFLPKVFQWGRVDILHLHDVVHIFLAADSSLKRWIKFCLLVLQLLCAKVLGIKIIWTIHEWVDKTGGKWGEIHPFWLRIISKLLSGIISHSQNTMDLALAELDWQDSESTAVIMHGNYIGAYRNDLTREDARKKLGIPERNFVFLLFGNILRSKGFLEAISAFKALSPDNCHLLMAGFPGEPGIEATISEEIEGLENILFFPAKIPDDYIQLYMNVCDCVMLPYNVFTTSGVAILSMSFAKACLVPKIGYFAEILDGNGAFFYNPQKPQDLHHAMQTAIDHQHSTQEMGYHNYDVVKQWSWDYVAGETANLYLKVLNLESLN